MKHINELHAKALSLVKNYLRSEAELLEIIRQIYLSAGFRVLGFPSLHEYCVQALKLSDGQAYGFSSVIRKSASVPELALAIENGELSVNTARKITSVITPENKREWLAKAITLRQKDLEREVARVNPRAALADRIKPMAETLFELRCGISLETQKILERCQDLESQRTQKAASLDETLKAMGLIYLKKQDPIQRAERLSARKMRGNSRRSNAFSISSLESLVAAKANQKEKVALSGPTLPMIVFSAPTPPVADNAPTAHSTRTVPAAVRHHISLRDRGQCVFLASNGLRCTQKRWTELHHYRIPFSMGGPSDSTNLITLCHFHHRKQHFSSRVSFLGSLKKSETSLKTTNPLVHESSGKLKSFFFGENLGQISLNSRD